MTKEEAIQILEQIVNISQRAGILVLNEVPIILEAIKTLKDEQTR